MSDFHLVDPQGWDIDLQSVHSAYMGYFQQHNIPWYERSWGYLFESFEAFLTFAWPVIIVTDAKTSRAHIVTRLTSVGAFLRMIKTRFGETIPQVGNLLHVRPFETQQRHLRTISDWATYRKLHSTLPAAVLAAQKVRVKNGDAGAIQELWARRDKTWLSIDFEWSERNASSCLEWGYATLRCGHLEAAGAWPPKPDTNYRRGHYVVAEYVDKIKNKHCPTQPWQYAFGDSQVIPKAKLPIIIQSIISLASPDSETTANNLVLVGHGLNGDLQRFEEMKIKLPHNVLLVDTASFERALFSAGRRGAMQDAKSGKLRQAGSTLSLGSLLHSLSIDVQCALHNSGNDAFVCLWALQKLLDPDNTPVLDSRGHKAGAGLGVRGSSTSTSSTPSSPVALVPTPTGLTGHAFSGYASVSPMPSIRSASDPTTPAEMGGMRRSPNSFGQYLSVGPAAGSWRLSGAPGMARGGENMSRRPSVADMMKTMTLK